jgi:hypothetical protein
VLEFFEEGDLEGSAGDLLMGAAGADDDADEAFGPPRAARSKAHWP